MGVPAMFEKQKLHTVTILAQRCHKLGISQKQNKVCKKGEPDRRLPVSTEYYTKTNGFCKYSIVTKIGKNFCEKAYEVENLPLFSVLFCEYFR